VASRRRLVDEDEARRIKLGLLDLQLGTRRSDIIRTILFGGVQSFLNVMSWRSSKPQAEVVHSGLQSRRRDRALAPVAVCSRRLRQARPPAP
jgi:hypothetical protein